MILKNNIKTTKPATITLDTERKDALEWLQRMINVADPNTKIVYWEGKTDWGPSGVREKVFEFMRGAYQSGRIHLVQRRLDDNQYQYIGVVR